MLLQSFSVMVFLLHVAHCMDVERANLAIAAFAGEGITDIDLSGMKFTAFNCLNWRRSITSIDLRDNLITGDTISTNIQMPNLHTLWLNSNKIASLNGVDLAGFFPALKVLGLDHNQLVGDDVFDHMELPSTLKELYVVNTGLSREAIQRLGEILVQQTPNLHTLGIDCNCQGEVSGIGLLARGHAETTGAFGIRLLSGSAPVKAIQFPTGLNVLCIDQQILDDMIMRDPVTDSASRSSLQMTKMTDLVIRKAEVGELTDEEEQRILGFFGIPVEAGQLTIRTLTVS